MGMIANASLIRAPGGIVLNAEPGEFLQVAVGEQGNLHPDLPVGSFQQRQRLFGDAGQAGRSVEPGIDFVEG